MVFQEGGQQPSTSGHQCRAGGNRMASAGQSSKPEMYSRAVQTGFPHPSDNANLHHPHQQLPICICGQAGEGNCWCESLGFLKDQELCRVVLQKGCPRSRFAVLLSMHEEFCKSARGDQIINTRRRGSAHGDIRVKRSKLAPPPTLPRPRAQSVIVQKTRAANRLNEANTKRSPQVSVKPKKSVDPTRQGQQKQDGKGKSSARVLPKKDQQFKKEKKCLENNALSNGTASKQESSVAEEGSHLDQTSYVSKAWLLFTGCETGKKTKDSEGSKPEAMCDDHHHNKESMKGCSSSVSDTKRLNNQAAHLEVSTQSDRKKDAEKVNRITGLSVSSKRKVTNKSESTSTSTESSNKYANRLKGRKLDSETLQTSDVAQRVGKPDLSDECDRTALLDSVTISRDDEAETSVSGACRLDPQDGMREGELSIFASSTLGDPCMSLMNRNVKDLDHSTELAGSELNERLKDNRKLDGSLTIPVKRRDHVSHRDSGIVSSGSVCESRLSATHSVMVEDKSESGDSMTRAETKNCHKPDSLSVAFGPSRAFKEGECNIPSEETNNSRMSRSPLLKTAQGITCSESNLQVEDDYLLGACAIVKRDHSVCNEYNSSSEGDGINTMSSKDKAVQGNCQSPAAKEEEFSFISPVIVIEDKETSEQCLSISDSKSCKVEGSRPDAEHSHMVQLRINVDLKVKHDAQNKLKKDNIIVKKGDRIVHQKVSKKSENERAKERKHQRTMNPRKVGILKYLICQSPLILSDLNDSDYEDSESELEDLSYNKEDQFATMPVEIVLKIFRELRTRDLSQLKFTCKNFYWLITRFNIVGVDSKWVEMDSYRNDPCMQCGKVRDRRGDVSLCYWHPKYYYRTGNGRHHWTCCLNTSKDAPGCLEGLHDNKWTTSKVMKRSIPRQWSSNMWHLCPHKVNMEP